ncbi:MAG: putative PEP-binding protein, partial [Alsobacter sp.]
DEEEAALRAAGLRCARPPLGIMVEVPAAALTVDLFDAAFFSIGTNDLTQYVTAAGRDAGEVATLADPAHPGVLRLIAMVVEAGRRAGREVSLCGDAAGDPACVSQLLWAGVRSLSVVPAALARTKLAIAQTVLP